MEKLTMCRICLVENVRMHAVADKSLQELYEKLTDVPFVAEDNRPMLACFICYAKLKQCCQFQRQCLQAEEMFAQMLNESYEHTLLKNRSRSQYLCGFVKTPIENISIVDVGHTESEAFEIEAPAVCDRQYDVEVKEEPPSDGSENTDNSCAHVKDVTLYSKSEPEDNVRIIEFKIELEEEPEVFEKERRAWEMEDPQCYVKKELNMSSDSERSQNDAGAFPDGGTARNEMKCKNEIEQKKKIQNKIRCQRYREKKKNTDATVCPQTKHKTMTAEDEERLKRRKEYDKQKSKRYRDRKRQKNIINLQADQSLKTVESLSKCKKFLSTQIAGPSTTNLPHLSPLTENPDLFPKKSENEDELYNDTTLQVNYVPQIHEPVITIYVPNTQNNTQLSSFSDGGKRGKSEETDLSDGTTQNETLLKLKERKSMLKNEIEERKKILNKIRCQRYRENKKRNAEAMGSPQTVTITPEDEEKIKLRREYDKQKSKRYRDRKRATIINLHTDKSLVQS